MFEEESQARAETGLVQALKPKKPTPNYTRRAKAQYGQIPISEASSHLRKMVKVYRTGNRAVVKGKLLKVQDGRLRIASYKHAGEVVLNVRFDEISKLEVQTN